MKVSASQSRVESRESSAKSRPAKLFSSQPSTLDPRPASGFTMVEIAICLAIIGIALVAIIGVLPIGINVQKENRQETLVDQDAAVFLENLRNGARGSDDLTNYVLAITNSWTSYDNTGKTNGSGVNGYTYTAALVNKTPVPALALTKGANIIGLLSTPEYTATNGAPIPNLLNGGYSNHVVAYVRSLSGLALEKPPQANEIILGDAFSYKIIFDNAPVVVNTPPLWTGKQPYPAGAVVSYILNGQITYWTASAGNLNEQPTKFPVWTQIFHVYPLELADNLHELRLTFLWPLLPNGNTGNGRHTFATAVAGQLVTNTVPGTSQLLYFLQPQSFTSAP